MDFFIKEENVRPGNRGGRDQFKWDNIRMMNNKDRESYLGVTQSIGFLDKGGKWRRRDWWLTTKPEGANPADDFQREKEEIRKREEQQWLEALNPGKNKKPPTQVAQPGQNKLTDYEWKELMKKEGNLAPDDTKLYEFYENDEKKAGVGMKQTVSFRTNPYENTKDLTRLDGNATVVDKLNTQDEDLEANPYLKDQKPQKKTLVDRYVTAYLKEKKLSREENQDDKVVHTEKLEKKEKKDKKEKKSKKHKHRSRSRSRDKKRRDSKSRSRSRRRNYRERKYK